MHETLRFFEKGFFLVLLLVLSGSKANVVSYHAEILSVVSLLLIFYVFLLKKQRKIKKLIYIYVVIFLYFLGYFFKFGVLDFGFISTYVNYATISFLVLLAVGKYKFFKIYVKVMVFLSIVAIPFYVAQLIAPFELFDLLKSFESIFYLNKFLYSESAAEKHYVNVIFYTLNTLYTDIFHRNSGFAFEPGFYAVYLVIAIYFNTLLTGSLLNKVGIILSLSLISTFSTTGILAFFIIVLFHFSSRNLVKITVFFIPTLLIIIIAFMNIDFLYNKIVSSYESLGMKSTDQIAVDSRFTGGRFFSLKVAAINYVENPIIGIGDYGEAEFFRRTIGASVGVINGIGNYIMTLGTIGVLLLLFSFKRTYSEFSVLYGGRGLYTLSLILLITSFAFSLPATPLFWVFMVFFLVPPRGNVKAIQYISA